MAETHTVVNRPAGTMDGNTRRSQGLYHRASGRNETRRKPLAPIDDVTQTPSFDRQYAQQQDTDLAFVRNHVKTSARKPTNGSMIARSADVKIICAEFV